MTELLIERRSMCGTDGWWWSLRYNGQLRSEGWTGGKRIDALRDARAAMARIGAQPEVN